jgi:hypothetical protein
VICDFPSASFFFPAPARSPAILVICQMNPILFFGQNAPTPFSPLGCFDAKLTGPFQMMTIINIVLHMQTCLFIKLKKEAADVRSETSYIYYPHPSYGISAKGTQTTPLP